MKIKEISQDHILFDNGNKITFDHCEDCCERNYADFEHLDDEGRDFNYDPNLQFEFLNDQGFRFGNINRRMFFIPCYSVQNGYYTCDIDIYYNGKPVTGGCCEFQDG